MKHMTKKGKTAIKKWGFRGKKCVFGVEKLRVGNQTRKAKWCKMQVVFSKADKHEGMKDQKLWLFTHFITYIFARTERKPKPYCKNKNNDLSF